MLKRSKELQTIAETRPLARRLHTCHVCGHPIAIGTRYDRIVTVHKGDMKPRPHVFKMHRGGCPAEVLNG